MKLKYLGTAAAEGIPALFCKCENCQKARILGGKNIRTRSQAIIDDKLLIDFPADTYMHFLQHNLPLSELKHCLITHAHADHLYPQDLLMRKKGFSNMLDESEPMRFYTGQSGYKMIESIVNQYAMQEIKPELVEAFKAFVAGGYHVTPVKATHDETSSPMLYLIEKDGKTIFYSNDSGNYPEETWEFFEKNPVVCHLISFDCTEADNAVNYKGHMNLKCCIATRERLIEIGMADESTIFVLNHFSHNGKDVLFEDFSALADKHGFLVSYDGLEIEV